MKIHKTLLGILSFVIIVIWGSIMVLGIDFVPSGNINGMGIYQIFNFTNVNATTFYQNGSAILDTNSESTLNVNNSDYLDGQDGSYYLDNDYWNITDYIINDSSSLNINETMLNNTINSLENDTLYYAFGVYIYKNGSNYFILNETKLNATISALDTDTNTQWGLNEGYIYNNSNSLDFNETLLNNTINSLENDTLYYAFGKYIYKNGSNYFILNETQLNATIDTRENDTTYTAGGIYVYLSGTVFSFNETKLNSTIDTRDSDTTYTNSSPITLSGTTFGLMTCSDGYVLAYNTTSSAWECEASSAGGDITAVNTNGVYLIGGSGSGEVNLTLNETALNSSIDARDSDTTYSAGSNITLTSTTFSWNGTWAVSYFIAQSNEGDLNVNYSTTSGTATTWDGETSQSDLNVNNSEELGGYTIAELNASWNYTSDTDTQLTEDQVEDYIFDNDNTGNLNLSTYNLTFGTCRDYFNGTCLIRECGTTQLISCP